MFDTARIDDFEHSSHGVRWAFSVHLFRRDRTVVVLVRRFVEQVNRKIPIVADRTLNHVILVDKEAGHVLMDTV